MSYILRIIRPSAIQNWIKTNAVGSLKNTGRESWRAYLAANSGTGQTLRDLEMSYLAAAGSTGGTLADRWGSNLNAQAGTGSKDKGRGKFK